MGNVKSLTLPILPDASFDLLPVGDGGEGTMTALTAALGWAEFYQTVTGPFGQPVKIHFDLYGKNKEFDGVINGIEMGTGNAFSLLPSQNATGNWIKVVQRVPVRIQLDPQQLIENPLRIGLSATVKVNVSDSQGETLRDQAPATTLYSTNVLQYDESAINNLIESIIRDNSH